MHAVRLGQVRRFWARTAAARCCISRGMAFWHADREAAHPPVALPPIVRLQRYGSMPLQPQAGNGQRGPAAAAAVGFAAVRIRAPLLVAQRPQPPAPVTRQRGPNGDAGGAHRCLRPDARARADGERRRAQQAKRQQRVVRMQRTQLRHKAGRVGREAAHQQRPRQLEQSHGKAAAREHAHPPPLALADLCVGRALERVADVGLVTPHRVAQYLDGVKERDPNSTERHTLENGHEDAHPKDRPGGVRLPYHLQHWQRGVSWPAGRCAPAMPACCLLACIGGA
mmetsp:Transcript_2674/g.7208  ORF Transcript_2674/g.7208 Transcript_2674/m.7208 type:complete len:282 (-) Transcript_2674:923-1768(-)